MARGVMPTSLSSDGSTSSPGPPRRHNRNRPSPIHLLFISLGLDLCDRVVLGANRPAWEEIAVQHFTMLVTPDGGWVSPNSAEFHSALGDPDPDYDAINFAVKNLGFIKFQVIQHSIVEVELHPRNVELPALLAVQQQLLSSEVKLFRIKYFENIWQSEISSSAEYTVERLSHLCAPTFTPVPTDRFLVEAQDYRSLFGDTDCPFRPLAQK
jgi:hypothetical protein